jgi:hypothetical protein
LPVVGLVGRTRGELGVIVTRGSGELESFKVPFPAYGAQGCGKLQPKKPMRDVRLWLDPSNLSRIKRKRGEDVGN